MKEKQVDLLVTDIRNSLVRNGYHYEPGCNMPEMATEEGLVFLLDVARRLGQLYVPTGLPPEKPVIVTQPDPNAPPWQPFNGGEAIGWHNDFSTLKDRPRYSLSWIAREDPGGPEMGAWRLASAQKIVDRIREEDPEFLEAMCTTPLPFGYLDNSGASEFFNPLELDVSGRLKGLRFYGRALREGMSNALSTNKDLPIDIIEQVIESISKIADELSVLRPATKHSLMVLDNARSLHNRLKQTTKTDKARSALLCFAE